MQVVARSLADAGVYNGTLVLPPSVPIRRDTLFVQPNGYAVLRFRADNPDRLSLNPRFIAETLTALLTSLAVSLS